MKELRKLVRFQETIYIEGGKAAAEPWTQSAVAAIVKNPWAGQFVDNLRPEILRLSPQLGQIMTDALMDLCGGGDLAEAFGKAAIVGVDGEIEHGSALIHTLHFGNIFRKAVDAKSYLSFTNTRGGPNTPLAIPMMDKNEPGRRSHYLTVQFAITDAPRADEIVLAIAVANGGRPHHRIGDRYQDLKDLGQGVDNPAGV